MQPNANSTENLRHKKSLSPIQKGKGLKSRGDDNTLEPCVYGYVAPFIYRHPDVEMAKRVLNYSV